jgi:hypothetical protein
MVSLSLRVRAGDGSIGLMLVGFVNSSLVCSPSRRVPRPARARTIHPPRGALTPSEGFRHQPCVTRFACKSDATEFTNPTRPRPRRRRGNGHDYRLGGGSAPRARQAGRTRPRGCTLRRHPRRRPPRQHLPRPHHPQPPSTPPRTLDRLPLKLNHHSVEGRSDSRACAIKTDIAPVAQLATRADAVLRGSTQPARANRRCPRRSVSPRAGVHQVEGRPYGLMVLEIDRHISTIFGFPDPWLFEQCGLPPELN